MSKVLIVEEDPFYADLISQRVKDMGYQTDHISNGAVTLDQMMLLHPDLVLFDTGMKSADPIAVLSAIHGTKELAAIPVVALSPAGDLSEIKKIIAVGVKDYVVKAQLNFEDLANKVKKYITPISIKAGSLAGLTVMWVEDDQFLSDLISRKLSTQKCKLLFARNGDDAIKILSQNVPDIIVLDILLPTMSGFDIFEYINKQEKLKNVPVIVLSNFSQPEHLSRAKQLGAKRYLVKATIELDALLKEIVDVLNEKQHHV